MSSCECGGKLVAHACEGECGLGESGEDRECEIEWQCAACGALYFYGDPYDEEGDSDLIT